MYRIFHNIDGEKITICNTDEELIDFVTKIAIENEDKEMIDTFERGNRMKVGQAIYYLETYCPNLTILKPLSECFQTLLYSWGGDTPPEAIWAANDFLNAQKQFYKELRDQQFVEDDQDGNNTRILDLLKSMGI